MLGTRGGKHERLHLSISGAFHSEMVSLSSEEDFQPMLSAVVDFLAR